MTVFASTERHGSAGARYEPWIAFKRDRTTDLREKQPRFFPESSELSPSRHSMYTADPMSTAANPPHNQTFPLLLQTRTMLMINEMASRMMSIRVTAREPT